MNRKCVVMTLECVTMILFIQSLISEIWPDYLCPNVEWVWCIITDLCNVSLNFSHPKPWVTYCYLVTFIIMNYDYGLVIVRVFLLSDNEICFYGYALRVLLCISVCYGSVIFDHPGL